MGEIETKFGIVAMVDALGAKNFTIEDSRNFIKHRDDLIEFIKGLSKKFLKGAIDIPDLDIATFGDTIIICWPIEDKKEIGITLMGMFHQMKGLVLKGITERYFYRGSIAVGDYIQYENTILGPAISDAAGWYEKGNWFGIILTPNCEFHAIQSIIEEKEYDEKINLVPIESLIVKYPVPIENCLKYRYSISWPFDFLLPFCSPNTKMTPTSVFTGCMSDAYIAVGTEEKYYNSLAFFEWYRDEIFPKIKDASVKLYL